MKYRRLNKEELLGLEKEFVQFLSSNTITADDWVKIKEEKPEQAEKLIEIFSDIVFDKILKKVEYLELKSAKNLRTFHCQAEKIYMIGILIEGASELDFTKEVPVPLMLQQLQTSDAALKMFKGEKNYAKNREEELFDLMQQGALISKDGVLYKTLAQLAQGNG